MRIGLLVLFLLGDEVRGAKILALFPLPFYSHTNTFIPVFKELAVRGHHITFLSPYPQLPPSQNWTNIVNDRKPLELVISEFFKYSNDASKYAFFFYLYKFAVPLLETALQDKAFEGILSAESLDYDLIVTETFYCHEALSALGTKHNIPVVSVFPFTISSWAAYFSGNEFLPSYIPNYKTIYSDHMSFLQRVDNALLSIFQVITGLYYYLPKQELLMKRFIYTNSKEHAPLYDILKNTSLHLIDTHYSLAYIRSYQPHTIPVGGLSTVNYDPLAKDLKDLMDTSSNGIIYVNFGSLLPVSSLSANIIDAFLTTFKKLNFDVIMKWENNTLDNKPPNVKIGKWFPQAAILAHQKCRLFINHGGLHGMYEALYYAVPIIGIPFSSDQMYNMKFAVEAGFGLKLDKEMVTANNFQRAIEVVLNTRSYKESALRRSEMIRDRPTSPVDTAVYWIEYALRHKDLSHLRPASGKLPIFQLFLWDVFSVIAVCTFITITVFYNLFKDLIKILIKIRPKNINQTKKKQ